MLDRLEAATRAFLDAQAAVSAAEHELAEARERVPIRRAELAEAIVQAARDGARQREIVRITGYTRESVRRILRAAGVEAAGDGN